MLLACAVCFSGCEYHRVCKASRALDSHAKTFAVGTNSSNIYVVYPAKPFGGAWLGWLTTIMCAVSLDGGKPEMMEPYQYRLLRVSPGQHTVATEWGKSPITLTTDPGRNYFLRADVHGKGMINPTIHSIKPIDAEEGRNLVLQSRLAGKYR